MNWKNSFAGLLTLGAVLLFADTPIAEWDFSKGLKSKCGKYELTLRGTTKLENGVLAIGLNPKEKPEGAATVKGYPALSPSGSFAAQATFSLDLKKKIRDSWILLDNKCVFGPSAKQKNFHRGFTLMLHSLKQKDLYIARAYFGLSNGNSVSVQSSDFQLQPKKKYTLRTEYHTDGTAELYLDGKCLVSRKISKGQSLASSALPLIIGDRVMSYYNRFPGAIYSAGIYQLPPPQKRERRFEFVWDLTKSLNSQCGLCKMVLRGKTKQTAKGLEVGVSSVSEREGLVSEKIYSILTPLEGFTIEGTFTLRDGSERNQNMFFCGNKYVFVPKPSEKFNQEHTGFALCFQTKKNESVIPLFYIGTGRRSAIASFGAFSLESGKKHTLKLDWDGLSKATLTINGKKPVIRKLLGMAPMAPAHHPFTIGDRVMSNHQHFSGTIEKVVLRGYPAVRTTVTHGRRAFYKGEEKAVLDLKLAINPIMDVKDAVLELALPSAPLFQQKLGDLAAGTEKNFTVPVETRLQVGKYPCKVLVSGKSSGEIFREEFSFDLMISPVFGNRMSALLWGAPSSPDSVKLCKYGITHISFYSIGNILYGIKNPGWKADIMNMLDQFMFAGASGVDHYSGGCGAVWERLSRQYPRKNWEGKDILTRGTKKLPSIAVSNPVCREQLADAAKLVGKTFGSHPAFAGVDIISERRDTTAPSYDPVEADAFQKFSGYPIPKQVRGKNGVYFTELRDFPADRIIPETYPIYRYYKWFWRNGDGWYDTFDLVNKNYHDNIHHEFFTFFDPALRQPPLWGAGGTCDMISHWTYAYPDPICVGSNTESLIAMASGRPGQKVQPMVQIICYRAGTAPLNRQVFPEPFWFKMKRNARFISIPPDILRVAVWSIISRKTEGVMFHGYGSLFDVGTTRSGYDMTNPETVETLGELLNGPVRKLGPVLKTLPERGREVLFLQSFTSDIFGFRSTWGGNNGWQLDAHMAAQLACLDPGIVFEEGIVRDGFSKETKVLCLFDCAVLPWPVYKKILAFQRQGGIIIGDEKLVPGIMPDILIHSVARPKDAAENKTSLLKLAKIFRQELKGVYEPYADSDNADFITRARNWKNSDYLFVINDKRTYGDYIGMFKMVREKGLPNEGIVSICRKAGAVYDLTASRPVPFTIRNGKTFIPTSFTTSTGNVFLVLDQPVKEVQVKTASSVKAGNVYEVSTVIQNATGKPVPALMPVEIVLSDPSGKVMETRYEAATDGKLTTRRQSALNDRKGNWKVTVKDLASGKTGTAAFTVK